MRDTRTVHVKVVQNRFVTICPPSEETHRFKIPALGHSPKPQAVQKTERVDNSTNATLLICRRMIDAAVHDAKETRRGLPTRDAKIAREWIQHSIPKPERQLFESNEKYREAYRQAFYMSFDWCCEWLNSDADEIRKDKLDEIDAFLLSKMAGRIRRCQVRRYSSLRSQVKIDSQGELFPARYLKRKAMSRMPFIPSLNSPSLFATQ